MAWVVRCFPRSALGRGLELGMFGSQFLRPHKLSSSAVDLDQMLVRGKGESRCPPTAGGDSGLHYQSRHHESLCNWAPLNFKKYYGPGIVAEMVECMPVTHRALNLIPNSAQ